jgi:hypothetical protein
VTARGPIEAEAAARTLFNLLFERPKHATLKLMS